MRCVSSVVVETRIVDGVVARVAFFKHLPEKVQHVIVSKLRPCVYLPGDVVLEAHERNYYVDRQRD